MSTAPHAPSPAPHPAGVRLRSGGMDDLDLVMDVMTTAFPAELGEGWTRSQCAGILPLSGVHLRIAEVGRRMAGFVLDRQVEDEAELLLIAVSPANQRSGVGEALVHDFIGRARQAGAERLHLEVRDGNPAERLYHRLGFDTVGRRRDYYRGIDGRRADALTLSLDVQD